MREPTTHENASSVGNTGPESDALETALASRRTELGDESYYRAFLSDLSGKGTMGEDFAEKASTAVLCALDEQLKAGKARDAYAGLPVRLQQLLRGCERPGEQPPLVFDREEFLATVADDLDVSEERAEQLIKAVFTAVREQLSVEETRAVAAKLPPSIQNLWLWLKERHERSR